MHVFSTVIEEIVEGFVEGFLDKKPLNLKVTEWQSWRNNHRQLAAVPIRVYLTQRKYN
jgi:hypothetical protein